MKKVLISMGFAALALGATAQVKIKDGSVTGSSTTPNSNAILELESNNKGLVYPRVALTSTSSASPLSAHVQGMTVYNTATAGSGTATAVTPGIYYNDGTQWVRVSSNVQSSVFIYGSGTPQSYGATCNTSAENTIYVDTLPGSPTQGQSWICSGSGWETYTPPASTEWNYAGSANIDAGSNKTSAVSRTGSVIIGANATPAGVATSTSGSTAAQRLATLTISDGDASINGLVAGRGAGQDIQSVALGAGALINNNEGYANTAIGQAALQKNNGGYANTAIGAVALANNISGNLNSALGQGTLQQNTSGNNNTAIGEYALNATNNGSYNTAVGNAAIYNNPTGSYNTALGSNAGGNLTSGSNNILIGYGAPPSSAGVNGEITIGGGNGTSMARVVSGGSNWTFGSDRRLKHDIQPITQGLDFIEKLKPVEYIYNNNLEGKKALGFIAQDVQSIMQQENMNPDKYTLVPKIQGDTLGLTYTEFIPILTKAIQEQQAEIKTLQSIIEKQQAEIDALKK